MDKMKRYEEPDEKELGEAVRTLLKKCTAHKTDQIGMIIQAGDLFLDAKFSFTINEASAGIFKSMKPEFMS